MNIEIKKSVKPIEYTKAIKYLENRVVEVNNNKSKELIWFLEHPSVYTAGSSYNKSEILDSSINLIKTKRGGKITWHGPGQLVCYFVLNLNNRKRDIRKFISIIENSIIKTLKEYDIESQSDRENIGIWVKSNNNIKKIAAIGIRIKRWIAYHGFSINIDNDLNNYNKIIPCGIKDKEVTNLRSIKNQNYNNLSDKILNNLINNLKI
jgi:lipoyl(octanoyl) transferase